MISASKYHRQSLAERGPSTRSSCAPDTSPSPSPPPLSPLSFYYFRVLVCFVGIVGVLLCRFGWVDVTSSFGNNDVVLVGNRTTDTDTHFDDGLLHLNMSDVVIKAQLPPPHAPWHVLPPAWYSDNEAAVELLHEQLVKNVQQHVEEEFSKTGSQKESKGNLLYMIVNATLLALTDQEGGLKQDKKWYGGRWEPMEDMIQSALDIGRRLVLDHDGPFKKSNAFPHLHPRLRQLVTTNMSNAVPISMSPYDWNGCSGDTLYPSFTYAMKSASSVEQSDNFSPLCIPFAVPCYEMWVRLKRGLKYTPSDWDHPLPNYPGFQGNFEGWNWDMHFEPAFQKYPWHTKIPKVMWRGSSTGYVAATKESHNQTIPTSWRDLPRAKLVKMAVEHPDTMDMAFTILNQGKEQEPYASEIKKELRPLTGNMRFTEFMQYKAVLDMNGNSWSSRFGHLFCLNSVVVKVEGDLVNYFEQQNHSGSKQAGELVPWVHYIPVHTNLSNLPEVASYIADPQNDPKLQQIVSAANQWCRAKMTVTQFAIDTLWMLLSYMDLVYGPASATTSPDGGEQNAASSQHALTGVWMQSIMESHNWTRTHDTDATAFVAGKVKVYPGLVYKY